MGGEGGEPVSEIGCEAAETSRSKQASEKKCRVQWSNSRQFKIAILVNFRLSKLYEMQNN